MEIKIKPNPGLIKTGVAFSTFRDPEFNAASQSLKTSVFSINPGLKDLLRPYLQGVSPVPGKNGRNFAASPVSPLFDRKFGLQLKFRQKALSKREGPGIIIGKCLGCAYHDYALYGPSFGCMFLYLTKLE